MNDSQAKREAAFSLAGVTFAPSTWHSNLASGLIILATAVGLILLWHISSSLLVVFAGVLLASLLDACTRALAPIVPLGRSVRLSLVLFIVAVLIVVAFIWSTGKIPEQMRFLVRVIDAQLDTLERHLANFGVELFGPEGGRDFSHWFPDHRKLFGHAQMAVGTASNFIVNTVIILFLGILFAFNPALYRDSIALCAKPSYRPRLRAVLDEMGLTLRYWLVGQVIRMALMAFSVWLLLYAIGLPGALLLGVQAGVSNFIPYLGPIVAAIPIGLVAMPLGFSMFVWSVGIYTIVQSIEGYVIGPVILRHAVNIPPAWTLVAIVLFGALFGVMGIAMAMPLVAIGRIAVLRFYVEDILGDKSLDDKPAETGAS